VSKEELVKIDEACEIIGVTERRLFELVDEGVVPAYLINDDLRFRRRELCSHSA